MSHIVSNLLRVILAFVFLMPLVSQAAGQGARVELPGGPVDFSPSDLRYLRPLLERPVPPTSAEITSLLANAPSALQSNFAKLIADARHIKWDATQSLARTAMISVDQLTDIVELFYETAVPQIVETIIGNPKSEFRFLARDSDELYHRVVSRIQSETKLSVSAKVDALTRINLAFLSRKVAKNAADQKNLSAVFEVLQLPNGFLAQNIELIDIGYFGSLVDKNNLGAFPELKNVALTLAFKGEKAPPNVKKLNLDAFIRETRSRFPYFDSSESLTAPDRNSFRVDGIEHQPKWFQSVESPPVHTLHLMLDVDDTILKEIDIKKAVKGTTWLTYKPSPKSLAKYKARLENPDFDSGKVIHYEISKAGVRSAVHVRPAAAHLLSEIAPYLASGRIKLYLTSHNDIERTKAVVDQVKIGGKSLREIGAKVVEKEDFQSASANKDFALFRVTQGVPESDPVIALDDRTDLFVNAASRDRALKVSPYAPTANDVVADLVDFKSLFLQMYAELFALEPTELRERIIILARTAETGAPVLPAELRAQKPEALTDAKLVTLMNSVLGQSSRTDYLFIDWLARVYSVNEKILGAKTRAALKSKSTHQLGQAIASHATNPKALKMIGTLSPLLLAAEELGRPVYVELERNPAVKSESWFLKLREKYEPANRKAARESLENIVSRSTRPHRPVETKLKSLQRDDLYVDVKSHMEENLKPIGRETEVRDAKGHHSLSQNGRLFHGWMVDLLKTEDTDLVGYTMMDWLLQYYGADIFTHFDLLVLTSKLLEITSPSPQLLNLVRVNAKRLPVFSKILEQKEFFEKHSKTETYQWLTVTLVELNKAESKCDSLLL